MLHQRIELAVHKCYWEQKLNCAKTILKILGDLHQIPISDDVLMAATGMNGAGKFRAQCGLVEGTLMFIGLAGNKLSKKDQDIAEDCRKFAEGFTNQFGSLLCYDLRPDGFTPQDKPYLCEPLTIKCILFANEFIRKTLAEPTCTNGLSFNYRR